MILSCASSSAPARGPSSRHYCSRQEDWVVNGDPYYVTSASEAASRAVYAKRDLPLPAPGVEYPYVPPKNAHGSAMPDRSLGRPGYRDQDGSIWQWDRREGHWDVRHPRMGQGKYSRVTREGKVLSGPRKGKSG